MIERLRTDDLRILGFRLSGKLHDEDYRIFVPAIDSAITAAGGKVRMFVQLEDFHGWDLHAAWDDFSFGVKHYSDIERIALIGDAEWEKWMTKLCAPFTAATVKYFDAVDVQQAWTWLKQGL
ncbi:MAG: STAS/SEC14 domain-containing protein [Gammaproteobacteria bacterium]|nr:STAS/SEC14 domain-containing protein [Gammaproteobacteria bacterium]